MYTKWMMSYNHGIRKKVIVITNYLWISEKEVEKLVENKSQNKLISKNYSLLNKLIKIILKKSSNDNLFMT